MTDTSLSGGAPGIMAFGTAQAGNWSGGDATSSSGGSGSGSGTTYSVGGTATGLTGTAVLQDNGGDNLTVTGDGPFTFATPLASGAAYDATVATEPAGQSCTVSGGTGHHAPRQRHQRHHRLHAHHGRPRRRMISTGRTGSLGSNWTDMADGGMAISSQAAVGPNRRGYTGDIWSG